MFECHQSRFEGKEPPHAHPGNPSVAETVRASAEPPAIANGANPLSMRALQETEGEGFEPSRSLNDS